MSHSTHPCVWPRAGPGSRRAPCTPLHKLRGCNRSRSASPRASRSRLRGVWRRRTSLPLTGFWVPSTEAETVPILSPDAAPHSSSPGTGPPILGRWLPWLSRGGGGQDDGGHLGLGPSVLGPSAKGGKRASSPGAEAPTAARLPPLGPLLPGSVVPGSHPWQEEAGGPGDAGAPSLAPALAQGEEERMASPLFSRAVSAGTSSSSCPGGEDSRTLRFHRCRSCFWGASWSPTAHTSSGSSSTFQDFPGLSAGPTPASSSGGRRHRSSPPRRGAARPLPGPRRGPRPGPRRGPRPAWCPAPTPWAPPGAGPL